MRDLYFLGIAAFSVLASGQHSTATSVVIVPPTTLDGTEVGLSEELRGQSDGMALCRDLWQLAERGASTKECNLFDDKGVEVKTASELQTGEAYHVVPVGLRFVYPPKAIGHKVSVAGLRASEESEEVVLETLSVNPPIFRLLNFITDKEVDFMIERAYKLGLERSTGGLQTTDSDSDVNQGTFTSHRTSTNAWDITSSVSRGIQKRSFKMLRFPEWKEEQADGLQVVKYKPGQFYHHHTDWFALDESKNWNWNPATGGSNRFATVFIYLSDTELGGETVFPYAERGPADDMKGTDEEAAEARDSLFTPQHLEHKMSKECRAKFSVTPKKGEAVLFYHQDRAGALDVKATHGACPVLRGEKWGANLWIWNNDSWTIEQEHANNDMPDPHSRAITIESALEVAADIYWVDPSGEHVHTATLHPGRTEGLNSYVRHTFVAKPLNDPDTILATIKVIKNKEDNTYVFAHGDGGHDHSEL